MNGLPLRYAGWMARDVLRRAGIPMAIGGALVIWLATAMKGLVWLTFTANGAGVGTGGVGTAFVLLATAGIISRDLVGGYYRTLFAAPVSPALYYLQRWIVGGAVATAALLLIDAVVAWRTHTDLAIAPLLAHAGLAYLLVGGLVLLLSTVTRRDWIFAVVLMFAHWLLNQLRRLPSASGRVADIGYRLLPPFHLVGFDVPVPTGSELAHVILYGIGLLTFALTVLRYRPLGVAMRD